MDKGKIKKLTNRITTLENENEQLKKQLDVINQNYQAKLNTDFEKAIQEHKKRENEISELLNATYSILKTNNFNISARNIFDACANSIGAKAGYVALLSDDGENNDLLFLEDGGMKCTVNPDLPMPVRGLRAEAYHTGKVVYDNDFMKNEWIKFMPEGHMPLNNVLFSPLNIEGKTVGIMGFACKEGNFDENDAKIAAAFGEYASIALQYSRTMERLTKLNATKDKFFSIISHDLKSPFNALLGFSELLLNEIKNNHFKNASKFSEIIYAESKQILNLLNHLLKWAQMQKGQIEFNPVHYNLKAIINEIIDIEEYPALLKNIRIIIKIEPDLNIYADIEMFNAIIRNLVNNAIKFTEQGGSVNISAKKLKNKIEISVSDTGIGIKPENIDKLFKIENGFSTSGTNNEKGSGLGLILCKEFIEIHSGEIGVESETKKGSRFWFTLPIDKKSNL